MVNSFRQRKSSKREGRDEKKKNNMPLGTMNMIKPNLNKSMVEKTGNNDVKNKTEDKKGLLDRSFLSQMSVEVPTCVPKRPKSSQGYMGKHHKGKNLIENFNKVFHEKKSLRITEKVSKKSSTRSKSKENKGDGHEVIKIKAEPKAAWSMYQTRCPYKESSSQQQQHLKKNTLREQARPIVNIPPTKAFPKELALINKLLITEKQKGERDEILGISKNGKNNCKNMIISTKEKALSRSVCVDAV